MELSNLITSVKDHPEFTPSDLNPVSNNISDITPEDRAHSLPDGSEFMVKFMDLSWYGANPYSDWSPVEFNRGYDPRFGAEITFAINGNVIRYLVADTWMSLFEDITTKMEDVRNGLITWVDGVYGDIQAGTLDTAELLTPREQAELTSDDEDFPRH